MLKHAVHAVIGLAVALLLGATGTTALTATAAAPPAPPAPMAATGGATPDACGGSALSCF